MNNKSKAFYGGGYVSDYSEYVNPPKEEQKKDTCLFRGDSTTFQMP